MINSLAVSIIIATNALPMPTSTAAADEPPMPMSSVTAAALATPASSGANATVTQVDHRRLDTKVATGNSWSGFTDLYTAGTRTADVTGGCGSKFMKGLKVTYDYESRGDIDRYNFELICRDSSRVNLGPYDTSKDASDWASPNGESTIYCPGADDYVVGMWGDRWRNENGDKDTFEFGLYCQTAHWELCSEIPPGVVHSCVTPVTESFVQTNLGHSGATRADGAAKCASAAPLFLVNERRPFAVEQVNIRKYRKSNGDWDFYDFQIKCD